MRSFAILLLGASTCCLAAAAPPPDPKGVKFFEDKIRPVLVQACYQCHSVDAQKAKKLRGGLFLDSREGLRKGGDSGAPLDGLLLKALRHDGDFKMPPKGKLPENVIADFEAWLKMGAPDPRDGTTVAKPIDIEAGKRYWAFQPTGKITPPPSAARHPIDAFLEAKRQAVGLKANGPALREKIIRRASFSLTGLPPTPQEIDEFLKDAAPDAYERLVERLLKSERFGERWARHWLDAVRFAESGGYEFDGMRGGAYHFRDFVINAFNDDLPFNEFIRLQIAGDHLKPGDHQALSATGFVVAGPYPGQTTAKTLELIRYDHLDDMLSTLGTSMLGLSMGCARCHDHKYDPLPQHDYYRMLAAFARTDSTNVNLDLNAAASRKAKDEFDKIHVPLVTARDKFNRDELPGRVQTWLTTEKTRPIAPWNNLTPVSPAGKPNTPLVFHTQRKKITALRLEIQTETAPQIQPVLSLTAGSLDGKVKPVAVKLKMAPTFVKLGNRHSLLVELEGEVGYPDGTVLTLTANGLAPELAVRPPARGEARPARHPQGQRNDANGHRRGVSDYAGPLAERR